VADAGLVQQAYTTILEHFVREGRAPHYIELAVLLELQPDEARELQREAASLDLRSSSGGFCWMSHDTDYVESWAPFSNVPTQHLITVDGEQKWYGQ
jgi:hypothetical protein